jgi:hypothetical protein
MPLKLPAAERLTQTQFTLSREQRHALKAIATRQKTSGSAIVRRLLAEFIDREGSPR